MYVIEVSDDDYGVRYVGPACLHDTFIVSVANPERARKFSLPADAWAFVDGTLKGRGNVIPFDTAN